MVRSRFIAPALAAGLFLSAAVPFSVRAQPAPEPFRDGERWVAMGDSITHSGSYHDWVSLFYLTRYPDRTVHPINGGISGDTATAGLRRLDWDVLSKRPTVCTIMFGMNDVGRALYNEGSSGPDVEKQRRERIDAYKTSMRALVARLQAAGPRVVLLTPSIFDETAALGSPKQAGVNEALGECASFVRQLANETGAALVDFYGPMAMLNRERQAANPVFTVVSADRIHPGDAGHLLMAYEFLKAQRVSGIVSRLAIDLGSGQIVVADNGVAEDIRKQADGGLIFSWAERAIPFPIDPGVEVALEWVPFTAEFNQEILQIAGLRNGNYELRIDDNSIGTFTAAEFAKGLNLAAYSSTPQYLQALDVLRLVKARAELVSDNLRRNAQVEHALVDALPKPVTLEQMQPLVTARLERVRAQNETTSLARALEHYLQRKERETDAIGSADRLARLAHLTAQPRPHLYLIRRAR